MHIIAPLWPDQFHPISACTTVPSKSLSNLLLATAELI
jgi:hypothetical protein